VEAFATFHYNHFFLSRIVAHSAVEDKNSEPTRILPASRECSLPNSRTASAAMSSRGRRQKGKSKGGSSNRDPSPSTYPTAWSEWEWNVEYNCRSRYREVEKGRSSRPKDPINPKTDYFGQKIGNGNTIMLLRQQTLHRETPKHTLQFCTKYRKNRGETFGMALIALLVSLASPLRLLQLA